MSTPSDDLRMGGVWIPPSNDPLDLMQESTLRIVSKIRKLEHERDESLQTSARIASELACLQIEHKQLLARVAELEKAVGAANRMIHRKYQSGDEELILAAMKGQQ